jgi:branched-chain amino acid transport system ATP-binding protein
MSACQEPGKGARAPLLRAVDLASGYGRATVVNSVNLSVRAGEVVALLGPNGAGKTTLLLTLAGGLRPSRGEVWLFGVLATRPLHHRVRRGLGYLPDFRAVVRSLRVEDNLRLGGGSVKRALEYFPALEALLPRRAGLLSGGEQQMVAAARTLAADPRLLIADEVSLGLAPLVARELLSAFRAAASRGLGVLLVEQRVPEALAVADRAYVLARGQIVLAGSSADLLRRLAEVETAYFMDPSGYTPGSESQDGEPRSSPYRRTQPNKSCPDERAR